MSGDKEDDVSLRDEIASAFAADNSKSEEIDNSSVIDKLEEKEETVAKDQPRAEDGKFTKKEEEHAEATQAKTETEVLTEGAEGQVKLTDQKAPSSWSPKVRERWSELPEEVRSEIIRREEASVNGVRKLQEEFAPVQRFAEALIPFIQEANQMGREPTSYIYNVMSAERQLRSPDNGIKFNALLSIADTYGIPLRSMINASAGKELLPPAQQQTQAQIPPEVQQELLAMRQWREEQSTSTVEAQLNEFKKGKEFYEDVRDMMADLLDAGSAQDLDDAYEKACWASPEVRAVMLQREKTGTKQEDLKKRQAAATGASVKSSGQVDVQVDTGDDDSIEDTVRKAMREASGRV